MTDPSPASLHAADTALSLLFRKLHPHLEDAAHALSQKAKREELERLHLKLLRARETTVAALEAEVLTLPEGHELRETLAALAADLTPMGETYRESLTLTQLCLEEAPAEVLPFLPEEIAAQAKWAPRLAAFFEKIEDPAQRAEQRWKDVDDDIGEGAEFDEE